MALKFNFLKGKKFWKHTLIWLVIVPTLLFSTVLAVVYFKQDTIVQSLLKTANEDFKGLIKIKESHVAPFANFPHISIDLEALEIFEKKKATKNMRIVHIRDVYIGFNLLDILAGKYDVKSIRLSNGSMRIVQHKDGTFNIVKAFESKKPVKTLKKEFHLDLQSVRLDNIDLAKLNESNGLLVNAHVSKAKSAFKTTNKLLAIDLDTQFDMSIIKNGDSTFIKRKKFDFNTEINVNQVSQMVKISNSEVLLEGASFGFGGAVDLKNDVDLDLYFNGDKPNFDLFLALAPPELAPTLKEFDNKGQIYFDVSVKGPSLNGKQPAVNARFGCKNGYFKNVDSQKKLEKIGFRGSFTNGKQRNLSSMRFVLEDFTARPEAGRFKGKVVVENFLEPEIDMNLVSDFDLDFLAKFVNSKELKGLKGKVILTMNFHDIIDLSHPEKSIQKLNESYFSKLEIKKLQFKSDAFHLPLNNLDLKVTMLGHKAKIEQIFLKVGKSDLQIDGSVSDLPAIIHHKADLVTTALNIKSNFIDIKELTTNEAEKEKGINEEIKNLRLKLKFLSSAKALSESKTLPIGEFFIEDLHAKMQNYPHELHDFHADLFVDENDFRVMDFSGMIDNSDFHFSGQLDNYNIWFEEKMMGDTRVEFDLKSKLLQFDNVFTYGGERFVPKDYQHEEIKNMKIHAVTDLHFKNGLQSIDFILTQFDGKMKVHPLKFENFSGKFHSENQFLTIENFKGKLGHSVFNIDLGYDLSEKNLNSKNYLYCKSNRLDIDELMNYQVPKSEKASAQAINHDDVFSIYDFNLPIIEVKADIGELNYHKYNLKNVKANLQSEESNVFRVNQLDFDIVGGNFSITGYLSGKDKKHIYFKPDIRIKNIDLDKFMLKFDSFGQDHLVAENLHGKFSGKISGKIHLHADLVPKIDDSEINIEMTVVNGRLENYAPIMALSDYFEDSKLKSVRFDTLQNTFLLKNSFLTIPKMSINTNLGFIELSGNQKVSGKMDMDYLIGIPWKMISKAAGRKLFKRTKETTESPEEIQYKNENARLVYVNILGDLENYEIKLKKKPK